MCCVNDITDIIEDDTRIPGLPNAPLVMEHDNNRYHRAISVFLNITPIHTNSYIFIHIHTYSYKFIHIHTYSYIFVHIHTYSYKFIHFHIQ